MSLLDGQLGKQSLLDKVVGRLGDINRLFRLSITVFVTSILLTPVVIYFCFRYFTATVSPWWLDVIASLNFFAFLLSGLATLVLGLAKAFDKREP